MRKIKRKLSGAWSDKRRYMNLKGHKFKDKISGNHYANKKADIQFKGKMIKRKWKNPKAGLKRKRYYQKSWR